MTERRYAAEMTSADALGPPGKGQGEGKPAPCQSDDDGAIGPDGSRQWCESFLRAVLSSDYKIVLDGRAFVTTNERPLGWGGMGTVVALKDAVTGQDFAGKLLHADTLEHRERVVREAKLAEKLATRTPYVVPVVASGESADGLMWVVFERIRGHSLKALFEQQTAFPPVQVANWMYQVAHALAAAHPTVIHRDVSLDNILIDDSGTARLSDFGLARDLSAPSVSGSEDVFRGRLRYAAPERLHRDSGLRQTTAAADVYALGVVMHELLAGHRHLERCTDDVALIEAILNDPPAPVRSLGPDVPEPLAHLVARCLARSPGDRPSAAELVDVLQRFLRGEATEEVRPPSPAASAKPRHPKRVTAALLLVTTVCIAVPLSGHLFFFLPRSPAVLSENSGEIIGAPDEQTAVPGDDPRSDAADFQRFASWLESGSGVARPEKVFQVTVRRGPVKNGLIPGTISVNGLPIGSCYENADHCLPPGTYRGIHHHGTNRKWDKEWVAGRAGRIGTRGDFLLEIRHGLPGRSPVYFLPGDEREATVSSSGSVFCGASSNDDPPYAPRAPSTLRALRLAFYGGHRPSMTPYWTKIEVDIRG